MRYILKIFSCNWGETNRCGQAGHENDYGKSNYSVCSQKLVCNCYEQWSLGKTCKFRFSWNGGSQICKSSVNQSKKNGRNNVSSENKLCNILLLLESIAGCSCNQHHCHENTAQSVQCLISVEDSIVYRNYVFYWNRCADRIYNTHYYKQNHYCQQNWCQVISNNIYNLSWSDYEKQSYSEEKGAE